MGIGISSDLTIRQMKTLSDLREQGHKAYYRNNKLCFGYVNNEKSDLLILSNNRDKRNPRQDVKADHIDTYAEERTHNVQSDQLSPPSSKSCNASKPLEQLVKCSEVQQPTFQEGPIQNREEKFTGDHRRNYVVEEFGEELSSSEGSSLEDLKELQQPPLQDSAIYRSVGELGLTVDSKS